ncbi:hypothetical protein, partial [Catellatospora coxensis]|uniref:hypothetical protein n=1 Tax=Catellatospora coxensis TaxID=310354 RepID=UPI0019406162
MIDFGLGGVRSRRRGYVPPRHPEDLFLWTLDAAIGAPGVHKNGSSSGSVETTNRTRWTTAGAVRRLFVAV